MLLHKNMQLLICLGNVGQQYIHTRHNAGWIVADALFPNVAWKFDKYAQSETAQIMIGECVVLLAKPHTFMNNSGETALYLCKQFNIATNQVIVLYDDIDVPVGSIKLSTTGNSNHNGIRSIIAHLKTQDFVRLRIGVGSSERNSALHDYVLGGFSMGESEILHATMPRLKTVLENIVTLGIVYAQNNLKPKVTKKIENIDTEVDKLSIE